MEPDLNTAFEIYLNIADFVRLHSDNIVPRFRDYVVAGAINTLLSRLIEALLYYVCPSRCYNHSTLLILVIYLCISLRMKEVREWLRRVVIYAMNDGPPKEPPLTEVMKILLDGYLLLTCIASSILIHNPAVTLSLVCRLVLYFLFLVVGVVTLVGVFMYIVRTWNSRLLSPMVLIPAIESIFFISLKVLRTGLRISNTIRVSFLRAFTKFVADLRPQLAETALRIHKP
jgi:hypothetical protein